MNGRTHVDLFTGLAGFSLAARANGVRTIAMCECDPRCRAFLAKAWPGVQVWDDVRTFGIGDTAKSARDDARPGSVQGQTISEPRDTTRGYPIWLLTAGVPCQPASRAGKQRGEKDNRWLWPATLAVLGDLQPTWALLENPPGIGDMDFAGILSAVETHGYEARVFSIPACGAGAPHRRERYWIVAHRAEPGPQRSNADAGENECGSEHSQGDVAHHRMADASTAPIREATPGGADNAGGVAATRTGQDVWEDSVWLPCADGKVRRAPGDTFGLVDGLHRSVLAALGNSIVWPVAARIIAAMIESEEP